MSIQTYECENDGEFDSITQGVTPVVPTKTCPTCGCDSVHVFRPLGRTNVKMTWNDEANEYQRDALSKVKASQRQFERDALERGEHPKPYNSDDLYKVAVKVDSEDKKPKKMNKHDPRTSLIKKK